MKLVLNRGVQCVLVTTLLFVLSAVPVRADGPLDPPHAFYGTLTCGGAPAPVGVTVTAKVGSVFAGRLVTTQSGKYGDAGGFTPKLVVEGVSLGGQTIEFYLNNGGTDVKADQTASFQSGEVTNLNLTSAAIPSGGFGYGGGGGGGGSAPAPTLITVVTSVFGIAGSFTINSTGIIQTAVTFTSADGKLTVTLPAGTKALDKNGNPLTTFTINLNTSPPAPPAGTNIIGLAYSFLPDGATFDPPIILNWSYDPNTLPSGAAEKDLFVAYWDGVQWQSVVGMVNLVTHTVTAYVSHFSAYALMSKIIATPSPTPTPTLTPSPTPTLTPTPTTPAPAPASASGTNWTLILGIIGAVIVVGVIVMMVARRKK